MGFFLERKRTRALRRFDDYKLFLPELDTALRGLTIVANPAMAERQMQSDAEMFPIRRRGTVRQVYKWIRNTLLADHKFAVGELSQRAHVALELRHYLVPMSGLELRTLVNTGEKGVGNIIWLQIVLRIKEDEYIWWSHD
jgi:hypothetical protein